jgi:hypothetical protein
MDYGYDYFKPTNYYSLQPEDLNPALRYNYRQDVNNYYSEPPMQRMRTGSRARTLDKNKCACGRTHGSENHNVLYILIIVLVIITVIQWFIIFFSNGSSGTVTINNITHEKPPTPTPVPTPVVEKKE